MNKEGVNIENYMPKYYVSLLELRKL